MSGGCLGLGSNKFLESTSELQMKPQVDLTGGNFSTAKYL